VHRGDLQQAQIGVVDALVQRADARRVAEDGGELGVEAVRQAQAINPWIDQSA
jgi:hypothetical protein